MSAFGRCARFCLSRLAHLPQSQILRQTQRNVVFNNFKQPVPAVSLQSRRNYQLLQEKTSTPDQRSKQPASHLDIFRDRFGRITRNNIYEVFEHLDKYGMANIGEGLKILRFTGQRIRDLNPTERMKLTERAWKYVEDSGLELEVSAFNNLLLVYLENKHKFSPPDFLATMEEKGVKPNGDTYQLLIAAYCEEGDIEKASHILEQMKHEKLETSYAVFNSLITGHFRAKDEEGALSILELMRQSDIEPTSETYTALLHGYAELGDLESMKKMIKEADEMSVTLKQYQICDTVLTAVNNGHEELAFQIVDILISREFKFFQDIKLVLFQMVAQGHVHTAFKMHKYVFSDGSGSNYLVRTIIQNSSTDKHEDKVRESISTMRAVDVFDICKYSYTCGRPDWALKIIEIADKEGLEIREQMFFPAYVHYTKNKDTEGLLHTLEVAMGTLLDTSPGSIIEHVIKNVIPTLHKAGLTTEDIISSLKTKVLDGKIVESACFWFLALSNPVKAMEFGEGRDIIVCHIDFQSNISKQWKDYFKMLEMLQGKRNLSQRMWIIKEKLLKQVLLAKVDTAENIIKEFTSMGLQLDKEYVDELQRKGHLKDVSQEVVQALLDRNIRRGENGSKRWNVMTKEELNASFDRYPEYNIGIQVKQLSELCKAGKLEPVEKLMSEIEASGKEINSPMVLRDLIAVYTKHKNLSMALKFLSMLETEKSYFSSYKAKLIDVCTLLTDEGRFEDVLSHIQLYSDRHSDVHYNYRLYIGSFEKFAASMGRKLEVKEALDFMDKMVESGFLTPSVLVKEHFLVYLVKGYIERDDSDIIVEVVDQIYSRYGQVPAYLDVFSYLVEREDAANLQKVTDIVHYKFGKSQTILNLIYTLVMQNKLPQAHVLTETPEVYARMRAIERLCEKMITDKKITELENMVTVCKELPEVDCDILYLLLMKGYVKIENYEAAKDVLSKYEEDGILPSAGTLKYLSNVLKPQGMNVDFHNEEQPEQTKETISEDRCSDNTVQQDVEMFLKNRFDNIKTLMNSERFQDEDRVKEFTKAVWNNNTNKSSFKGLVHWLCRNGKLSIMEYIVGELVKTEDMKINRMYAEAVAERNPTEIIEKLDLTNPDSLDRYVSSYILFKLERKAAYTLNRVLDLMKEHSSNNPKLYSLLWQYHFVTDTDKATQLLEDAPDSVKNNIQIYGCGTELKRRNKADELLHLLDVIRKYNATKKDIEFVYGSLLEICVKLNNAEKARDVAERMRNEGIELHDVMKVKSTQTKDGLKKLGLDFPPKTEKLDSSKQETDETVSNSSSSSDSVTESVTQHV